MWIWPRALRDQATAGLRRGVRIRGHHPEGDIYPCHQFVGNEDYKLGSLYDGTFDKELSGRFAGLNIYTREECKDCWARFYCSGGCSASNLLVNGDIKSPTVWAVSWSESGWSVPSPCGRSRPEWRSDIYRS